MIIWWLIKNTFYGWLVFNLCYCDEIQDDSMQRQLFQKLFRNYNSYLRPIVNDGDVIKVYLGLSLQKILNINEEIHAIVFSGWLDMHWYDFNLKWNPADYGNISKIRVPVDKIWTPADNSFDSTSKVNAVIEYTGEVEYVPPGMFRSTCDFKIKDFPFDRQVCSLKFGCWTHDDSLINLVNSSDRGQNGSYIKNPEWILENIISYAESMSYDCCPEKFPYVMFDIHIRRRTLYYEFNLIFPCIFISSLTLLGFMLPPDGGEKIKLEASLLLVIITFSQTISNSIPLSSLSVSRIGFYFMSIIFISSMSILSNIVVLIIHHRNVRIHDYMPKWAEVLICDYLARVLLMERPAKIKEAFSSKKNRQPHTNMARNDSPIYELSNILQQNNQQQVQHDYSVSSLSSSTTVASIYANSFLFFNLTSDFCSMIKSLHDISKNLSFISKNIKNNKEYEEKEMVFKFAAVVIDRLCVILFTILLILSTAIVFTSENFLTDSDPSDRF